MPHNYREELKQLLDRLGKERDELQVQFHLAKAEARDDWKTAEKKWQKFKQKSEKVIAEVDHVGGEVKEGLLLLADEIKKGYHRMREQLR